MEKSRRVVMLISLSLALLAPASLVAQGPRHHPGGPPASAEEMENIRENIETLRMYKLLEALNLTSEQSAEFLPALKEFQDAKRRFFDDRRAHLRELEEALESEEIDEKKLEGILAALESSKEEFQAESGKFLAKAQSMLTLQQRARLQLFEERFERKLWDRIRQMRGKGRFMEESR